MKHRGQLLVLWLAVIAAAAMIFFLSAQDGEASTQTSDRIVYGVLRFFHPDYDSLPRSEQRALYRQYHFYVRKGAHFSEFALLGGALLLLFRRLLRRRPPLWAWIAGALYACMDELHQKLIHARTASWRDVAIDSAGVLFGIAAAAAVSAIRRRKGGGAA